MNLTGLDSACLMAIGVMGIIGMANLVDFRLRTMAEEKARRAEMARVRKWGIALPKRPDPPRTDEHLWHF